MSEASEPVGELLMTVRTTSGVFVGNRAGSEIGVLVGSGVAVGVTNSATTNVAVDTGRVSVVNESSEVQAIRVIIDPIITMIWLRFILILNIYMIHIYDGFILVLNNANQFLHPLFIRIGDRVW